ncbi:MAG: hypothetical protein RL591_58 [Planctomycetota bacterium]
MKCGRGRSNTSAERSEAREDDVPRLVTCRVASPLVMVRHGRDAGRNEVPWSLCVCSCVSPLPSASQKGSATRNDQRRLHSIAQASLRSAFDEVINAKARESGLIHAKASESGHLKRSFSSPPVASAQIRVPDVSRCERSEHREPSEPWTFELQGVELAETSRHPFRWLLISLRSINRHRAPVLVAVAVAAAPSGVIHAKARELRSRLRALVPVAVAAAAAPSGVIHAKASKLRSRS